MTGSICIGEIPRAHGVLPDDVCKKLIRQSQQGDKLARDRLVESNLRLVMGFVHRFAGRGAEEEDLFQMGMIGLLKAIDHFDLSFDLYKHGKDHRI